MKRSQMVDSARKFAGTAAKYAVASGLADRALRRGMRMRRKVMRNKVMRKSRPNFAKGLVRGLIVVAALAGVALIGPKLLRREPQYGSPYPGEMNPTPTA